MKKAAIVSATYLVLFLGALVLVGCTQKMYQSDPEKEGALGDRLNRIERRLDALEQK
ncbi:MAG: hypothetical protein JW741_23690 [Sedimentisphaerales bacterium]|nr:hypothetical protein [Sedimentisphaerales bacterium]